MSNDKARELDAQDPLAGKRSEFLLPDDTIYLDGNSLGPLPRAARDRMQEVVNSQWGNDLIGSWNIHNWIDLPTTVGRKIGRLIGAADGQVICCDSISVNLFKLLSYAMQLNPSRNVILSQSDNFPTDLYVTQGLAGLLGEQRCQLKNVATEKLIEALDESVAVLMLTHVNFRSGAVHDLPKLTSLAQQKGILVVWDLAHSAGALPLDLDSANVDFAVGCGYKYLNGGPGAPAFLYVAKRLQNLANQPLQGWMGDQSPFDFKPDYRPSTGVTQFLCGTSGILSMAALDAALDIFADVDMQAISQKSRELSDFFIGSLAQYPALEELILVSPSDPQLRGSQLAYSHPDAYAICQTLIDLGVIVDFRAPDIIRFGFTPLYTSFLDVWTAAQKLNMIVDSKLYMHAKYQTRLKVT